jgi:hypothetical protein
LQISKTLKNPVDPDNLGDVWISDSYIINNEYDVESINRQIVLIIKVFVIQKKIK